MTDTENVFDGFALLGDDEEFDVDKIFGSGSDEPAPPPPMLEPAEEVKPQSEPEQVQTETAESQPEPEQTFPAKTQDAPAKGKQPLELFSAFTGAESDPIPEAAPVKSIAPRPQTQLSLFDKPPVFQYGGAREQITDADMTFEALRIQKADDFPELEDASAVTWQVRYGDITKTVPAPKTDTIATMKAEIEKSKAFLDSLKKGKVKDPECVVKPQIRMQKKGIADYKGVFPTLEAARASNKVICLIPAWDGQTYEMRRSELGEFIAPKHKITEFSEVRAGFRPALPRIPQGSRCPALPAPDWARWGRNYRRKKCGRKSPGRSDPDGRSRDTAAYRVRPDRRWQKRQLSCCYGSGYPRSTDTAYRPEGLHLSAEP